jgi:Eukaryotic protein of unknown function (DUF829)
VHRKETMASSVVVRRVSGAKAVALVLGPLGASPEGTVNGFGMMYQDRNCTTVAATSPPLRFFLTQHRMLKPTATAIILETAKALRETPKETPLVVHMFSNGGAFLLEEMELLMSEVQYKRKNQPSDSSIRNAEEDENPLTWEDVELIQQRMEYLFFDSCPCYLHMMWDVSPYFKDAFPNPAWHSLTRKVYYLGSAFSLSMWCVFTGSFKRSCQFWSSMERNRPYCKYQVYYYTTADMLTDATRIDQLIEKRRQEPLNDTIVVHRFDDSGHCTIYHDHSDDYNQGLDEALETASINRRRHASTDN